VNQRPDANILFDHIRGLIKDVYSDSDAWLTIYHNKAKPSSRLEKESKDSSKLLPTTEELPTIWIQLQVWYQITMKKYNSLKLMMSAK